MVAAQTASSAAQARLGLRGAAAGDQVILAGDDLQRLGVEAVLEQAGAPDPQLEGARRHPDQIVARMPADAAVGIADRLHVVDRRPRAIAAGDRLDLGRIGLQAVELPRLYPQESGLPFGQAFTSRRDQGLPGEGGNGRARGQQCGAGPHG